MRRFTVPAFVVILVIVSAPRGQDVDFREELAFAEALRQRGDNDLALEVIGKLRKVAPPEFAKELSLEEAKTRLRAAGDEPETARRLRMYREAREDFQRFIDANPDHPRVAEANRDIARLLNLQGRTELNQVYLAEDKKAKKEQAAQARATLQEAAKKLEAAVTALEAERDKLPGPEGMAEADKKKAATLARSKFDREINETKLDIGLNLYDQASSYLNDFEPASKLLVKAGDVFKPFADHADNDPTKWKAQAWYGRVLHQTQTADKSRGMLGDVLRKTETAANTDGHRLAKYFWMLGESEQPDDKVAKTPGGGVQKYLMTEGKAWRKRYKNNKTTPEGCGVTFLLASAYRSAADNPKNKNNAVTYRKEALKLFRELEQTENEYTDRARRAKFRLLALTGELVRPIESLKTFDDCFVRAQYETYQMNETAEDLEKQLKNLDPANADPAEKKVVADERERVTKELKSIKDDPEKYKKRHVENIIEALKRGLGLKEVGTMKASQDLASAQSLITYWAKETGKYEEAIEYGEKFARGSPKASQAPISAVSALQAYNSLLDKKAGKSDEAEFRARMVSFAQYMCDRWGGDFAGEFASHIIALQMLKEDNPREAIKKLATITPAYGSYALTRFQLADAALKADKEKLEPIEGDRPGDYRKRAMLALESMPASCLGPDTLTNYIYFSGKAMYGRDLYRFKRFAQMDAISDELLPKLAKVKFSDDDAKDAAARTQLQYELASLKLYARYGLADAAMQAHDYAKAAELLDPLINQASKAEESPEKSALMKDGALAGPLLMTSLRANLLQGKIDRTEVALEAFSKINPDDAAGAQTTLRLVAFLIKKQVEDLRKANDSAALEKAITGYTKVLDKQIAKQKMITTDFLRVLAECYSSMEQHAKAAATLEKVIAPKEAKAGTDEDKQYKAAQVSLVRELRLSKDKANLAKARTLIDAMRGDMKEKDPRKMAWGRRSVAVTLEHGILLEAEEKWEDAFRVWAPMIKPLSEQARSNPQAKEIFFEVYYHQILCYAKVAQMKPSKEERDKALHTAALQLAGFEKGQEGFGSEASTKRFTELLKAEPLLREQYEAIKNKK